jgi:hypothetical protein
MQTRCLFYNKRTTRSAKTCCSYNLQQQLNSTMATETVNNMPFTDDSFFNMKGESDASTVESTPEISRETPDRSVVDMMDSSRRSSISDASSYIPPSEVKPINPNKGDTILKSSQGPSEEDRPKFLDRKSFLERQVSEQFSIMKLLDPSSFHDLHNKRASGRSDREAPALQTTTQGSRYVFPSVFQKDAAVKEKQNTELLNEVNQMLAKLPKKEDEEINAPAAVPTKDRKTKSKKKHKTRKHKKTREKRDRKPSSRTSLDRSSQDLVASAAARAAISEDQKRSEVDSDGRPSLPKLAEHSTLTVSSVDKASKSGLVASPTTAQKREKLSSSLSQLTEIIKQKEEAHQALKRPTSSRREEIRRLQQVTQSSRRKERKSSSRKSSKSSSRSSGEANASSRKMAQSMPELNSVTGFSASNEKSRNGHVSKIKMENFPAKAFVKVKKTRVKGSEFDSFDGFSDDDEHSGAFASPAPVSRKLSRKDANFSGKRMPRPSLATTSTTEEAAWDSSFKDMVAGKNRLSTGEASVHSLQVEDLLLDSSTVTSQGNSSQASHDTLTSKSEHKKLFHSTPVLGNDWVDEDMFAIKAAANTFLSPPNSRKKPPLLPKEPPSSHNGSSRSALLLPFPPSGAASRRRSSAASIASSASSGTGMSKSRMTSYTADQASYIASSIFTGEKCVMTESVLSADHSVINSSIGVSRSSRFSSGETRSYRGVSGHSISSANSNSSGEGMRGIFKPPSPHTVPDRPRQKQSQSASHRMTSGSSVAPSARLVPTTGSGDAMRRMTLHPSSKMRRKTMGHSSDTELQSPARVKQSFLERAKQRYSKRKKRYEA